MQDRINSIRAAVEKHKQIAKDLEKTIVNEDARDFLLAPSLGYLKDLETEILPLASKASTARGRSLWLDGAEVYLRLSDAQLKRAQKLVKSYGPNLRVVGG
jgi:hypothetical protein